TTGFGRPDLPELVSPATPAGYLLFIWLPLRLWSLRPVLAAAALPTLHADRIERPPHDVVPHARKVLHASAANEHDRVFLEVVPHARDVGRDLYPVGEPDPRDLPQRRVRLLRRGGEDADADPPLLRRSLKS